MVMSITQWGLGRDMFRYAECAVFELSVFRSLEIPVRCRRKTHLTPAVCTGSIPCLSNREIMQRVNRTYQSTYCRKRRAHTRYCNYMGIELKLTAGFLINSSRGKFFLVKNFFGGYFWQINREVQFYKQFFPMSVQKSASSDTT